MKIPGSIWIDMVQYHDSTHLQRGIKRLVLNLLQAIFGHLGFGDSWGLKRTSLSWWIGILVTELSTCSEGLFLRQLHDFVRWGNMGSIDFFVPCLCCLCFCKLLFELRLGEAQKRRKRKHLSKVEQAIQRHEILCSINRKQKRHQASESFAVISSHWRSVEVSADTCHS